MEQPPAPWRALSPASERLALGLGQNDAGAALAQEPRGLEHGKQLLPAFLRALAGKGTAPTIPQPGFGLGQGLPVHESTLLYLHI